MRVASCPKTCTLGPLEEVGDDQDLCAMRWPLDDVQIHWQLMKQLVSYLSSSDSYPTCAVTLNSLSVLKTYRLSTLNPSTWEDMEGGGEDVAAGGLKATSKSDEPDPLGLKRATTLACARFALSMSREDD